MKLEPEKDHEPENVLVSFPYRLIIIIFYYYVEGLGFFYFLFKVFENLALFQEKAHGRVGDPCTNFEVSPSQRLNFGILP